MSPAAMLTGVNSELSYPSYLGTLYDPSSMSLRSVCSSPNTYTPNQ